MEKTIVVKESILKSSVNGEYLLVTDHEAVKYSCFQEHKVLWACLDKNMSVTIDYEEVGKYKNIVKAIPMAEQIRVDKSKITEQQVAARAQEFSPQEIGMWWKEVGEHIRAGTYKYDTPIGKALILAYNARMHLVLGIEEDLPF